MYSHHYGPACYRATAIPALPPPEQEAQGFFDTALGWGNYANLDSVTEVESQLDDEEHLRYEEQEKKHRKPGIYCDAERWSFERVSKIPYLIFAVGISAAFLFPIIWGWLFGGFYLVISCLPLLLFFYLFPACFYMGVKRYIFVFL